MKISFEDRVVIVTGAGGGLGRSHALALSGRGAKVLVNDINLEAANAVSQEIAASGREAMAFGGDISDLATVEEMIGGVLTRWGRIDVLVNNAGLLRDRTFANMTMEDFRRVVEVNLFGSANCTWAVWNQMKSQNYGRVLFTTSSSGLFGSFGQANYGAAKIALVGLMQTLALEGERYGIRVNCLAPSASTAMTQGLYPDEALVGLAAENVSPAVLALCCEQAPTRMILLAGAGGFEASHVTMTRGIHLGSGDQIDAELLTRLAEVTCRKGEIVPQYGSYQYQYEVNGALARRKRGTQLTP